MKIDSIGSQTAVVNPSNGSSAKILKIQREIQQTNNDLNQINKKIQLSEEDKKQKKEYEQKLKELEIELQQAKQEKVKETKKAQETNHTGENEEEDSTAEGTDLDIGEVMEPGKGANVDILL